MSIALTLKRYMLQIYLHILYNDVVQKKHIYSEVNDHMRKTKIICTMGPATEKLGILEALIDNGMNVARFNFSHGDHNEQKKRGLR